MMLVLKFVKNEKKFFPTFLKMFLPISKDFDVSHHVTLVLTKISDLILLKQAKNFKKWILESRRFVDLLIENCQ